MKENITKQIESIKALVEKEFWEPAKDLILSSNGNFEFTLDEFIVPENKGKISNLKILAVDGDTVKLEICFDINVNGSKKTPEVKNLHFSWNSEFKKNHFLNFVHGYVSTIVEMLKRNLRFKKNVVASEKNISEKPVRKCGKAKKA